MLNNKPTIVVTGGAGYIGSHTIIELINETNYEVISIDNYANSSEETFKRIEKITGKKIINYPIDLCDFKATNSIFKEHSQIIGVIHFAAFKSVPESVNHPLRYYDNNINSLINILKCISQFNISNFIFSSSCSVYGDIDELPVKEDTPLQKAASPYGYTKQIGEQLIHDFSLVNTNIKSIALRYFNPVGAHVSGLIGEVIPDNSRPNNLVPVITGVASGKFKELNIFGDDYETRDGTCIRDYIHVSDIARAHVDALSYSIENKYITNFNIFNLGTGNGVSVLEAVHAFEEVNNTKLNYRISPRRPGDVMAIYSDSSKAEELLHWIPKYSLQDMMKTAWKWELYQKDGQ